MVGSSWGVRITKEEMSLRPAEFQVKVPGMRESQSKDRSSPRPRKHTYPARVTKHVIPRGPELNAIQRRGVGRNGK